MNKMNKKLQKVKSNKGGFTLIELIVVIAIIGILAAIMLPKFAGFTDSAKKAGVRADAKNIYTAAEAIKIDPDRTITTAVTAEEIKAYLGSSTNSLKGTLTMTTTPASNLFTYAITNGKTFTATCTVEGVITIATGATT